MHSSTVIIGDLLLAVLATSIDLLFFSRLLEDESNYGFTLFDPSFAVIVLVGFIAVPILMFRRRSPVAVNLTLAAFAALTTIAVGYRPLAVLLIALYTAAAYSRLMPSLICLGATLAAHVVVVQYEVSSMVTSWERVLVYATLYLIFDMSAWGIGRWVSSYRSRARELVDTRAALAAEAVDAERLRIAHELHDIIAHAVTVMVVQATGAGRLIDTEPQMAREAVQSVQNVGRQAMTELRRLLEVLRTVADDSQPEINMERDRLAQLETLAESVRAVGVNVDLHKTGLQGRLDPSIDLTAYRVVQEALTNVARHVGPGATVRVGLDWSQTCLGIDITDDGRGQPDETARGMSTGMGFIGLSERVKLVGGDISAGPMEGGGYRVRATLPVVPA